MTVKVTAQETLCKGRVRETRSQFIRYLSINLKLMGQKNERED